MIRKLSHRYNFLQWQVLFLYGRFHANKLVCLDMHRVCLDIHFFCSSENWQLMLGFLICFSAQCCWLCTIIVITMFTVAMCFIGPFLGNIVCPTIHTIVLYSNCLCRDFNYIFYWNTAASAAWKYSIRGHAYQKRNTAWGKAKCSSYLSWEIPEFYMEQAYFRSIILRC